MKLGSLPGDSKDGVLVVVSRDLTRATAATHIAPSLREALEAWDQTEPALRELAEELEAGRVHSDPFDPAKALAPLPRAWQWLDGSTYPAHAELMATAMGHHTDARDMLMYQGMSHRFLGPCEAARFVSEDDDIDFEGEFGVIIGDVPLGASIDEASKSIRLLVQVNDWSLRGHVRRELKIGFGWIHAKPACSMAPVAVTPDEAGEAWRDGRLHLPLLVDWNGRRFGQAVGSEMAVSFAELIAYAAQRRDLCAGTIVGSGTVANQNYKEVGSSTIAERRGIEMVEDGEPHTSFLRFGDTVRMEALALDGSSLFGAIEQRVVRA